jgi:hypothetical protein
VGPGAGLEAVEQKDISVPCRKSNIFCPQVRLTGNDFVKACDCHRFVTQLVYRMLPSNSLLIYASVELVFCCHWQIILYICLNDRFCGLVVRVSGYRFRGPG